MREGLKSSGKMNLVFLIIAIIGGCCGEAAYWISPENTGLRTICKIVTVAGILAFALTGKDLKKQENKWIFAALVLACLADVLIVYFFLVGAALFALGHICLIILFYKKHPLSRTAWILWGIISAACIALVLILGAGRGANAYGAAVYAPILVLMVCTAIRQKGTMLMAAFAFLISDVLLVLYNWGNLPLFVHLIYMALFYIALLLFAAPDKGRKTQS